MPSSIIPQFNILGKYAQKERLVGAQEQRSRNKLLDYRKGVEFEQGQEESKLRVKNAKFVTVDHALRILKENARLVNWENYGDFRKIMIDMGLDEMFTQTLLPAPANFVTDAQDAKTPVDVFFNDWKEKHLSALPEFQDKMNKLKAETAAVSAGTARIKAEQAGEVDDTKERNYQFKIQKAIANIEKARESLRTTGGISDALFDIMAAANPEMAAKLRREPDENYLMEFETWLRTQLTGATATPVAQTGEATGITHEYRDGKLTKVK